MGLPVHRYRGEGRADNEGTDFTGYTVLARKTMNCFDVMSNINKFYTLELHEAQCHYRVFTQHGRLGEEGVKNVRFADGPSTAQREYDSLVRQKEKKDYKPVEVVESATGSDEGRKMIDQRLVTNVIVEAQPSSLHPVLQRVVLQMWDEANKKLAQLAQGNSEGASPLGKLSEFQIAKGRTILQQIASIINHKKHPSIYDVLDASNEYFALIPRSFGRRTIAVSEVAMTTLERINDEMDILKFYEDAVRMGVKVKEQSVDSLYEALCSDLEVVDPLSDTFESIRHQVNGTESARHSVHLKVKNVFSVRQQKAPALTATKLKNDRLLYHGSRSANLPGILSSHLKLPNQLRGVEISGAMLGGGLYFADQSTKSSQYSSSAFGGTANKYPSAFMFLCEVALGNIHEASDAHYFERAPRGFDSVMGVAGKTRSWSGHLAHNEYVVYTEAQQSIRYLIEFEPYRRH